MHSGGSPRREGRAVSRVSQRKDDVQGALSRCIECSLLPFIGMFKGAFKTLRNTPVLNCFPRQPFQCPPPVLPSSRRNEGRYRACLVCEQVKLSRSAPCMAEGAQRPSRQLQ